MDRFTRARNTAVVLYPRVFQGVIYIFTEKTAAKLCSQVNKPISIEYSIAQKKAR